jgi:hypothetical protein
MTHGHLEKQNLQIQGVDGKQNKHHFVDITQLVRDAKGGLQHH